MTVSEFKETKSFISVMVFFYVFMALYNIYNVTLKTTATSTEQEEAEKSPEIITTYKKVMSWKGITAALVIMYVTIAMLNVYKTVKR